MRCLATGKVGDQRGTIFDDPGVQLIPQPLEPSRRGARVVRRVLVASGGVDGARLLPQNPGNMKVRLVQEFRFESCSGLCSKGLLGPEEFQPR